MKTGYATSWNRSVQPRKQRKYIANAPLHVRGKFLSAHLSKELRKEHNTKSARVRTGDKVKVMRGQFKGKEGDVERVILKDLKIHIHGVEIVKPEGGRIKYPVHASNVMITHMKSESRRMKDTKKKSRGEEK